MTARILVTGAAGRVGRCVARRLAQEALPLRLLVQRAGSAPALADAQAVAGDFNDPQCMAQACAGVEAAFMYVPQTGAAPAVFRAARAAGLRRLVLLSSAAVAKAPPGPNPIAERHRAAEDAATAAGLACTFIRPDTMAANCLQWAAAIRAEDCVRTAHPDALRNPVHEDDLALLAVQALLSDAHAGRAYYVTGPQVLSIREQVRTIAALRGRDVQCVELTEAQALARMLADTPGLAPAAAQRLLDYLRKSLTQRPPVSEEFRAATGAAPRSFAQWVRDHLPAFAPPDAVRPS